MAPVGERRPRRGDVVGTVEAFRAGRPVVVTDHPGREDEGDLVVAAEHCTEQLVAFMMTHCRGLICVPLLPDRAAALDLPPMVPVNTEVLRTAFTVSVDASAGVSTGISAADRATTISRLVDAASGPEDLVRPGHVFPLVADPGGVRSRAGHTEAAVDLARLAGVQPVGVICEIADRDGVMLRGARLRAFCRRHGLAQISIDELRDHLDGLGAPHR